MLNEGPAWIGIGAQRCGTTWFTDLLLQHPRVDVPEGRKEHHVLYLYGLMQDWTSAAREEYRATFTSEDLKLGEFTPGYMRTPWICELTRDVLPEDCPILVIVRDPVDRFASAVRHEMETAMRRYRKHVEDLARGKKSRANENVPLRLPRPTRNRSKEERRKSIIERIAIAASVWWVQGPPKKRPDAFIDRSWLRFVGSDALWGGMYAAQLAAWTAVLPEERFIVLQYEKLREAPQRYVDLVWKRLGLDPVPLRGIGQRSSSSTLDERWIPEDNPHVVRALQQIYRSDAERLAERFEVDLDLWKRTMAEA